MKRILRITVLAVAVVLVAGCSSQPAAKAHALQGKVEGLDDKAGTLKVNHGKVEGYMEAMTMDYPVDDPEVLKKVKVGDEIKATVYDGDFQLHNVEVVPSPESK